MDTLVIGPTVHRERAASRLGRRAARTAGLWPMRQTGFSTGFSIVELMVTLTIVAILLAIGVPSYRYVTNSSRATSEVNGLLGDLQFARSEAIKEGQTVTVCPSSNGTSCLTSSNVWNTGWIVFQDPNANATVDSGETILRVQKGLSVTTDSFTSDNSIYDIMFNREGFVVGEQSVSNGYFTITLHTTPTNNQWTRCLQVTALGALTAERYTSGVCQ